MPGTPQPVPISIGIKDFPESPNLRKMRSITNATRAIYPQDSKKAKKRNSTSICGTKPSTEPTPPTMPSKIRLCSHSAQWIFSKPLPMRTGMPGTQMPKFSGAGSASWAASVYTERFTGICSVTLPSSSYKYAVAVNSAASAGSSYASSAAASNASIIAAGVS